MPPRTTVWTPSAAELVLRWLALPLLVIAAASLSATGVLGALPPMSSDSVSSSLPRPNALECRPALSIALLTWSTTVLIASLAAAMLPPPIASMACLSGSIPTMTSPTTSAATDRLLPDVVGLLKAVEAFGGGATLGFLGSVRLHNTLASAARWAASATPAKASSIASTNHAWTRSKALSLAMSPPGSIPGRFLFPTYAARSSVYRPDRPSRLCG